MSALFWRKTEEELIWQRGEVGESLEREKEEEIVVWL